MQNDAQHGIHGPVREALGRAGEVAGRVVHQHVDRAEVLPDRAEHRIHGVGIAHVAGPDEDLAAMRGRHLAGRFSQHRLAAAGDRQLRAQLQEALAHRPPQPRAAAGDDDDFVFEEIGLEHGGLRSQAQWMDER